MNKLGLCATHKAFINMKKQTFQSHGANIYIALLLSAVLFVVLGVADVINFLVGIYLAVGLGFIAGNVKLLHGYLFNEGRMKTYNGILLIGYNLVCFGWVFVFILSMS